MISLNELKKDLALHKSALSIDGMKLVVQALQEKMKKKGQPFNPLVLHNDLHSDKNEWVDFLVDLEKNKTVLSDGTRYQILCKTEIHWSTVDILITKGALCFFLLDAANSYPHVFSILEKIYTSCPGADLYYCGPSIQRDDESCGYFALDHAVSLAKLESLHQSLPSFLSSKKIGLFHTFLDIVEYHVESDPYILLKGTDQETLFECAKSLYYVRSENLPVTYGSLLKNIQSLSTYKKYFSSKEYLRHNGEKLEDYITKHTVSVAPTEFKKTKLQAHALLFKKEKLQKMTLDYLESHTEEIEKADIKP